MCIGFPVSLFKKKMDLSGMYHCAKHKPSSKDPQVILQTNSLADGPQSRFKTRSWLRHKWVIVKEQGLVVSDSVVTIFWTQLFLFIVFKESRVITHLHYICNTLI